MSNKRYDAWFCDCGVIQLMDYQLYDWMQEKPDKRRVVRVCQHCGATRVIWLSEYEDGYAINGADFYNHILSPSEDYEYHIIFDRGIEVPLKCGFYADSYRANRYVSWHYVESEYGGDLATAEKSDPDCCTVDVKRLIKEVNDEDKIQSIAGYVSGINWSGTKYKSF